MSNLEPFLAFNPGGTTQDPFTLLDRPVSQAMPQLTAAPANAGLWGRAASRGEEVSVIGVRELAEEEVAALSSSPSRAFQGAPLRGVAKMKARHHEIARVMAAGAKDTEISHVLEVSLGTLHRLRRSPAFQQLLFSFMAARDLEAVSMADRLQHGAALALERITEVLEDESKPVPLNALKDITFGLLDRAGYNPTTKIQAQTLHLTAEDVQKIRRDNAALTATFVGGQPARPLLENSPAGSQPLESPAPAGPAVLGESLALPGPQSQGSSVREELDALAQIVAEREVLPVDPVRAALDELLG